MIWPILRRLLFIGCPALVTLALSGSEQPKSPAASANSWATGALEAQTRASVMRDYLQAWQSLGKAFAENRPNELDGYFVGAAKQKLADTIQQQQRLGIETAFNNQNHDPDIVFLPPDRLSIELLDRVEYQLELRDHGRVVGSYQVRSQYIAVMTPTETKWKVRLLQATPSTKPRPSSSE